LLDPTGKPLPDEPYKLALSTGEVREGTLDKEGKARFEDLPPGKSRVQFKDHPQVILGS